MERSIANAQVNFKISYIVIKKYNTYEIRTVGNALCETNTLAMYEGDLSFVWMSTFEGEQSGVKYSI